jgi:hypothetical protein
MLTRTPVEVLEAVGGGGCGDLADEVECDGDVVGQVQRLQVDVSGGAARVECSEQDATLENEMVIVSGGAESGEEPFQDVQGQQLVGGATLLSGHVLQVEVSTASNGLAGRLHSSTSRVRRSGVSARGNCEASRISCPGWEPRRVSHRRKAS